MIPTRPRRAPRGVPTAFPSALASLGLALGLAAALASPAEAQKLEVEEIVLDNGMKVLLVPREGDPNVAAGWIAKVGSVNERPGITGLSHLFEHMMFKGTHVIGTRDIEQDLALIAKLDETREALREEQAKLDEAERLGMIADAGEPSARSERHQQLLARFQDLLRQQKELIVDNEFDEVYTSQGGSGMNAGTSQDFTIYFINVPANKLELWFWMESDRLANPVFRQFYSERDVVHEERRMRTDSTPTGRLDEQFDAMFWMASPYSWPVIGWPSDLEGITRAEAEEYFDRNYAPGNLTAALVGDFDPAEARRLAEVYFGRLERSEQPPTPVRTWEPKQLAAKRLEGEAETRPTVKIRWHAVPYGHADEPALQVLADLLNGQTGRLNRSLVQQQEVATSASAAFDAKKYGGSYQLTGIAAPDHSPEDVERALIAEIETLQEELVPDRELQKVKNQTLADKFRRLESNFFVMLQLLVYDNMGEWSDMLTESDEILAVTPADVKRVASKYFPAEGRNVAIYRTKKTETDGAEDPLWAALDDQQRVMASQVKAQIESADADQLRQALAQFSAMQSQVPEQARPVMVWAESYAKQRLESLEGGES